MIATRAKKIGRRAGKTNKGYWFRNGRGWYDSQRRPLTDENGTWLRDKGTPDSDLRHAVALALVRERSPFAVPAPAVRQAVAVAPPTAVGATLTVAEVCDRFLSALKADGASAATYRLRANYLFDFCTGLPASFRGKPESTAKQIAKARIHDGYGGRLVSSLIPADIHAWLAAHPGWKGSRRIATMSIKHPFHWAGEMGLIPESPIRKVKDGKAPVRLTYITPDQESAMMALAHPRFAVALKICIRCGFRPNEFCRLTAAHVHKTEQGLIVRFALSESKTGKQTGKPRVVYVKDPEIVALFMDAAEAHPVGTLFRGMKYEPWNPGSLNRAFQRVRKLAERNGVEFPLGVSIYSTRHTFAKRVLGGFYSGKPTNVETLARLMGNSPVIARKYAEWCDGYTDPLWAAV